MTVGRDSRSGRLLVYLNVTPRQGGETVGDWPRFRLGHLRDDGESAVHVDGVSPGPPRTRAAPHAAAAPDATSPAESVKHRI